MKIVFISDACIPSPSAEAVFVVQMAQALADNGHQVRLLVPDRKQDRYSDLEAVAAYYGVAPAFAAQTIAWPAGTKAIRLWAWRAAQAARLEEPDLVYARHIAAGWAALAQGLSCIVELHQGIEGRSGLVGRLVDRADDMLRQVGGRWSNRSNPARDAATRQDCRELARRGGYVQNATLLRCLAGHPRLARVVVITHALERDLVRTAPQLAGRIQVSPDGASLPASPPVPVAVEPGEVFHVGYCGHLYAGKGIALIATLARQCPWARFHVVGGLEADLDYWRSATDDCANIVFHGHIEPHRVIHWLAAFDVCLLPNQPAVATYGSARRKNAATNIGAYTSPMKMFEYMAAGKPIVASDLAVLREVLTHDENALLCAHDDVRAWAGALSRLAGDAGLRERLGAAARADLKTRYTWSARARRVIADLGTETRTAESESP